MGSNPFLALFSELPNSDKQTSTGSTSIRNIQNSTEDIDPSKRDISDIIEKNFFLTINKSRKSNVECCVYFEEIFNAVKPQSWLDFATLKLCLFERLLLKDPQNYLDSSVPKDETYEMACETTVLNYLYGCYDRLSESENLNPKYFKEIQLMKGAVLENCCLLVTQPELFENQNIKTQLCDLFFSCHSKESFRLFVREFTQLLCDDEYDFENTVTIFSVLFEKMLGNLKSSTYLLVDSNIEGILNIFSMFPILGKVFMKANMPKDTRVGRTYMSTVLGALLSISCLPKSELDPFEFFDKPSSQSAQVHSAVEGNIWTASARLNDLINKLFYSLLKLSPEVKHLLLCWISGCLEANSGRTKLWNTVSNNPLTNIYVSDGFSLNLSNVLSNLCQPFCSSIDCNKLIKINCNYGKSNTSSDEESFNRSLHMKILMKEVFLVPGDFEDLGETFNFTTEIFFICHKAFDIGYRVIYEKFLKLNQELGRLQRLYNDARLQGREMDENVMFIKDMMDKGMTKYLSYKAALLEPKSLNKLMYFQVSTCLWLKLLTDDSQKENKLSRVPEFLPENVIDFLIFLRRFSLQTLEDSGELLKHILMFIVTFMGSPDKMKNPHLRAKLAECLEAILPTSDVNQYHSIPTFNRDRVFNSPEYVDYFVPSLLHVFVSIEMTGQSVAFEQKFNYRRPMYIIMAYLWKSIQHKNKFKALAVEAEKNIEGMEPPLFLRFINLLINDAIFLLDEGLQYMSQLKNLQSERESGNWMSLPSQQRQELEANFSQTGMLARFHNAMGLETIKSLEMLTSEIKTIFCHASLVDRIASMLNYFLLNLVGPQKKNFKVKDLKEYDFQPGEIVFLISKIYLNLGESSQFCSAISRDGRSYKPELFNQANDVLVKIGHSMLISDIEILAKKVEEYAEKQRTDDELASTAPEEFLDPIMSTVMSDPVKLPSSGVIVDRSTISRHLLSDQTDPFNRSPLSMDSVVPCNELKDKIENWLQGRRK